MNDSASGVEHGFSWYQSTSDWLTLDAVVTSVPELVRNRYIAVVAIDGAPFRVSPEQQQQGWMQVVKVAISPKVGDPRMIPKGERNEWFVLGDQQRSPSIHLYNALSAAPLDLEHLEDPTLPSIEQAKTRSTRRLFWRVMVRSGACAFLGDSGNRMIVVSKDPAHIRQVMELDASRS